MKLKVTLITPDGDMTTLPDDARHAIAHNLSFALAEKNPRFDRMRLVAAATTGKVL